ncbi:MAG: GGDEF domain-containing protein, partial [Halofilum sp. (in: g-proteobacteria)]
VALAAITIAAIIVFALRSDDHIGADYTSAASNIVRGQHEASILRHASESFLRHPDAFHQQRVLRVLDTVESREGTTRNSFARLNLTDADEAEAVAEFERVLEQLPRLRRLAEAVPAAPERRDEFRELAGEVENALAFTYSTLHRLNHVAANERQQLVRQLATMVLGLGALLLLIVSALLWSVDRVLFQREALQTLTVTDTLTGLPNRRALLQKAEWELAQQQRSGKAVSLALLDIDHFKRVNDREGHPAGDRILEEVGKCLAALVRGTDVVARLGGEEFGLLMPDTGAEGAHALCERIRLDVRDHLRARTPESGPLTVSLGITTSREEEAARFDTLYARADKALYEAKRSGRDRVATIP